MWKNECRHKRYFKRNGFRSTYRRSFLRAGPAYGGSCFPKDTRALIDTATKYKIDLSIVKSTVKSNNLRKIQLTKKIEKILNNKVKNKKITFLGVTFKPNTDDMREAPAIYVVKELVKRGAKVLAYDPKAMDEAKHFYLKDVENISYVDSKYKVLERADALILLTEWKEFRSPDFNEIKYQLKSPIIFDGRNQYNVFKLEEKGFEYHQIGKLRWKY